MLTIIAFGTLTLVLHAELLRGDRAAMGLACFIGLIGRRGLLLTRSTFPMRTGPKERHSSWDIRF